MSKVRLGDVCEIQSGGTPSRGKLEYWENGTIPWVKISDFDGKYLSKTEEKITIEGLANSSAKLFEKGTILYTIFATLGETCILNINATTNQAIAGLRVKDENILPEYLYHYLVSQKDNVNNLGRGVAQNNINLKILREMELNIPTINKQIHIASVLDKVTDLIALRKQQLAKLDELVKARFVELFGLPVSNSKKWDTEKMKDIAPAVNYSGGFEETVWLLNLDMVEAQTGRIIDYLYVSENEVGNSTCTFDTSNVLYSKLRPYLNKVVIPDRCGYATSEMIPLKPNPSKIERTYLAFMLRSDEFVKMINEKVAGAKMPRVSMSDFRDFNVPVPPMGLQKRFAAFVEQTDKSKLAIQKSLDELETLKKALMQEYFGEED